MKSYLEISITTDPKQRELLIPAMVELGCNGFEETDSSLLCYFEKSRWEAGTYEGFKDALKNILHVVSVNADVRFREFSDENWNELWERSLQPIEIGARLAVKPSWCSYENIEQRIVIEIDPKMSFGTGYHETTRLTMSLLEKHIKPRMTVLDFGTGTGILAIAAVKLGASSAIGLDIDEWSIENAKENIVRNQVEDTISVSMTPLQELAPQSFDLVTANLTLNSNIEYLDHFRRVLKAHGIALLSGLLKQDKHQMLQALNDKRFEFIAEQDENGWIALAASVSI